MATTTNESSSSGSPDLSSGAAGVEIPVIVHASRYSASAANIGKSLPPVHEDTHTVIVFDQGAVVRLTASMMAGELVVLTNKLTGADVICKVTGVKAQAGIQNYVSLEFTQRAPGFWGTSPASKPPVSAETASSSSAVAHSSNSTHTPEATAPAASIAVAPVPAEPVTAKLSAPQTYTADPNAPVVAEPLATIPAPQASEIGIGSRASSKALSAASSSLESGMPSLALSTSAGKRPREFGAWERGGESKSKNGLVIAVAAVVVLALAGAGGWLFLRPNKQVARAGQAGLSQDLPNVPPPAEVTEPSGESFAEAGRNEQDVAPSNEAMQPDPASLEPATAKGSNDPIAATVPSSVSTAVSTAPVGTPSTPSTAAGPKSGTAPLAAQEARRSGIDVTKMRAPSVKAATVATSSEAPPELLAQPGSVSGNALSDNFLASSSRTSTLAVPPSMPSKGGQLVQPKLVSTHPAVYPVQARDMHIQGDVTIDAFIDETGRVAATKVINGPVQLQQAAIQAVRTWVYQPARLDGQIISIHILVTVSFHLQ